MKTRVKVQRDEAVIEEQREERERSKAASIGSSEKGGKIAKPARQTKPQTQHFPGALEAT